MAQLSRTNLKDQERSAAVRVKKVMQSKRLNGLEEGEDAMADEEGEGETGTADWRVRAGPRNKPTAKAREEHEATHMPFRDLSSSPRVEAKFYCELSDDAR